MKLMQRRCTTVDTAPSTVNKSSRLCQHSIVVQIAECVMLRTRRYRVRRIKRDVAADYVCSQGEYKTV